MSSLPNVLFVLGGPGAGKGTQCAKIVENFGYLHLSAGDLLRAERNKADSKLGEEIEAHIKNGTIVPVEITCSLLENAMVESGKMNVLIDGFPRNKDNLDGWNRQMGTKANVKAVLFFECSNAICVERCLERGKNSGRTDDNVESLTLRIKTYNESTLPIIQHFDSLSMVKRIEAAKTEEEVYEQVTGILESL